MIEDNTLPDHNSDVHGSKIEPARCFYGVETAYGTGSVRHAVKFRYEKGPC